MSVPILMFVVIILFIVVGTVADVVRVRDALKPTPVSEEAPAVVVEPVRGAGLLPGESLEEPITPASEAQHAFPVLELGPEWKGNALLSETSGKPGC